MQDPSRPATGYPAANGCPPPHSGTAYPYAAPPPQSQSYQKPRPVPSSQLSVCWAWFAVILLFVVIVVLSVLPSLFLHPWPDFSVDSFTLTNFSVGSNSLTGTWNVRLVVGNPNKKMSVSYDYVVSRLYYSWGLISTTRLPPFKQGNRNQTSMSATFSTINTFVDTLDVNDINEKRTRGSISFDVFVRAVVHYKARWWWPWKRFLYVWCEDLPVAISSNSSSSWNLVGGARGCSVALSK